MPHPQAGRQAGRQATLLCACRVPVVLRELGVLEYSEELASKVGA